MNHFSLGRGMTIESLEEARFWAEWQLMLDRHVLKTAIGTHLLGLCMAILKN